MTIQQFENGIYLPSPLVISSNISIGSSSGISNPGDQLCMIFQSSETNSIQNIQIEANVGSITNPYIFSLQTVTSSLKPSGILVNTQASTSVIPVSGLNTISFSSSIGVTQGQYIALVITSPASGNGTFSLNGINYGRSASGENSFPLQLYYTASTASYSAPSLAGRYPSYFGVGIQYLDKTYCTLPYNFVNTGSNYAPAFSGISFNLPFSCFISGIFCSNYGTTGVVTITLYDGTGVTILGTITQDIYSNSFETWFCPLYFDKVIQLESNTNYKLLFSAGNANLQIHFNNLNLVQQYTGLDYFVFTTCTNYPPTSQSDWVDNTSSTLFNVGLIITGLDDGTGKLITGPTISSIG